MQRLWHLVPSEWTPGQPECLSDETGGVHWRDTREWPSKVWDCVGGKWTPGKDILQPIIYTATDIIEGTKTRITQTSKGIINNDYNTGTWVVISGAPTNCPALNGPHQITTGYNEITINVNTSTCGQVNPSSITMQFQHSNWDTKNMGEFKNNLGAEVRGNVFRNCLFPTWQSQKCRAFLLNLTSEQDGPTSTLSELTFTNNKFYHAAGGIEEGTIFCDSNNIVSASKIIRGTRTQLLDSGCSFIPGDNITVQGAPSSSPWSALNGTHSVLELGSPGFGGDAFIDLDSTNFPAPDFQVTVSMDVAAFGPNRTPREIKVSNNLFKLGHPNIITGGWIGGQPQFSSSTTPTYWYSLDIGHMAYVIFGTTYSHNTFAKPEFGQGYSIHASIIPSWTTATYPRPSVTNENNIWEGNFYQGYLSETPCTKAIESHFALPMHGSGNVSTRPTNVPAGSPPSGYDKYGCENQGFIGSADAVGYIDYHKDNFRLASSSPHKGKATDGSDPGIDQNVLDWETAGVINGTPNPYLDMQVKSIRPLRDSISLDYIAYDTTPCTLMVNGQGRNFSSSQPEGTGEQDGRRGSVTITGLMPASHYWLRLTCAGRYRDSEFSTQ